MNFLPAVLAEQQLLFAGLLAMMAAAYVFRSLNPGERRTLRLAVGFLWLAMACLAATWIGSGNPQFARAAVGSTLLLGALGSVQVLAAIVFRGLLPPTGFSAPRIVQDLVAVALSLACLFVWLRLVGVEPAQLFTTSALVTAVVAFAMQDTLGNMLGGIVVQLDHSLRVGDWVRLDDVNGRVVDVRWRYTAVETRNRELVIVPNSLLMKNRFYVLRTPAIGGAITWRRGVDLRVDAAAEPSEVVEALERAVADADIPHVLKDPPPSAVLMEVASGYCRYTLRYWLSDPQHDDPADSAVRTHALAALERGGFRLGMPQEQRLTVQENEGWRAASEEQENARRLQAIQRTDLFAGLPLEEQRALASHLVHAPFAQGDVMTRQGAVAQWLYLIVRGSARVYVDVPAGRMEVAELEAGSVFGEMGMLTGAPRTATVVAVTAVDCYRLDKVGFAQVLQRRPEIAREIAATVQSRNEERNARLASAGATPPVQGDILSRVLSFFSLRE